MKISVFLLGAIAIVVATHASVSNAGNILFRAGELRVAEGSTTPGFTPQRLEARFSISRTLQDGGGTVATLFDKAQLRGVGSVSATAATDPNFSAFVKYLTDGKSQMLHIPWLGTSLESQWFKGRDLKGYVIEKITFEVTDFYLVSPGRDPNRDGHWSEYYLGHRTTIEGHAIPEPAALGMSSFAAVSTACYLRRFRPARRQRV